MNTSRDIKSMKLIIEVECILTTVNEVWEHRMKLSGADELNG